MKSTQEKPSTTSVVNIAAGGWYAWINMMPPPPDDFHVIGEIEVANPGVKAELTKRIPQGINQKILLLDLHLVQQPGMWPQVMTSATARYDQILTPKSVHFEQVQIFYMGSVIATLDVEINK